MHGNWFGQSSFATYAVASARNAVKVPEDLPLELLGPLGCGLQTGAGSVLDVLGAKAGESIAVFGLGGVGLGGIMAAKAVGCDPIIAVDLNPAQLMGMRAGWMGRGWRSPTSSAPPARSTRMRPPTWCGTSSTWPRPGCTTRSTRSESGPSYARRSRCCARPAIAQRSGSRGSRTRSRSTRGTCWSGAGCRASSRGDADPQTFIPTLIRLYSEGAFPFDRLVKTFPFSEINAAIEASESGAVIKPVVVFDQ